MVPVFMPRKSVESSPAWRKGRIVRSQSRALLLIDNGALQRAAWKEFRAARAAVAKAMESVTRHEQTDVPQYRTWLHLTFPTLLNQVRDLGTEFTTKERAVREVEYVAMLTGRSPHTLWKEWQSGKRDFQDGDDEDHDGDDPNASKTGPKKNFFDDFFNADEDDFENPPPHGQRGQRVGPDENPSFEHYSTQPKPPPPTAEAKDVYRRLVQKLHPDRGGPWTPRREQLWHQAQEAWALRDVDRLLRLESEWDADSEDLSSESSLGRLRRAIRELFSARRDVERQLREYRESPEWRFSLLEKKRPAMARRIETSLTDTVEMLRDQLETINIVIARWEKSASRKSKSGLGRRPTRRSR